ncbi:helix-turn-helix domain-containing protein [Nocardia colli]|uniref:Helix-turn-helix domain-containing protein n=1 Tax=Nocardia colli TaxID=2545717 RepID=A0A5N0E7W6_9NOCA|nr:helix-turn-helix domain-containing protein [Nocardia colli]KAA8884264.1 helix-turn-helix domain-containing protein [Nocardia colli]
MTQRHTVPLPQQLITMREAARQLGLSVRTLERLISTGDLKAYKVGARSVRVDPQDLSGLVRPILVAGGDA